MRSVRRLAQERPRGQVVAGARRGSPGGGATRDILRGPSAMRPLRIALAQCRQTASLEANERTIFRFLDQAGRAGAQVVCFPETQTVGYRVDIATPDTPMEPDRLDDLHRRVARRCGE